MTQSGATVCPREARRIMKEQDQTLIEKIAGYRDRASFEQLFVKYEKRAYNLAFHLTQDRELARDAVQEALLDVWLHAARYRPGNETGWILRIVANKSLTLARRNKNEGNRMVEKELNRPVNAVSSPADISEKNELIRALADTLQHLPKLDRQVLALRYGGGFTQAQIGEMLSLSHAAISVRLGKASEHIRTHLLKVGWAASMPDILGEPLTEAICFGQEVPTGLRERVIECSAQPDPVASASNAASPKAWASLTCIPLALAVLAGGWYLADSRINEKETVPAVAPLEKLAEQALPIKNGDFQAPDRQVPGAPQPKISEQPKIPPVHKIWNFDKAGHEGLEVTSGQWVWKSARNGFSPGMYTDLGSCVNVRPLVQVPPQPLKITMVIRNPSQAMIKEKDPLRRIVGALWDLEGRLEEQKRVWRNRKYPDKMIKGRRYAIHSYLFDEYTVGLLEDQFVFSVIEHDKAFPDHRVLMMFMNFVVERIEMHTIDREAIPLEIRDPQDLAKKLMAKGKLTLDP